MTGKIVAYNLKKYLGRAKSHVPSIDRITLLISFIVLAAVTSFIATLPAGNIESFRARPFNQVHAPIKPSVAPAGLTPTQVRAAYKLTHASSGSGTIAIIDAYDDPTIENDLGVFDQQFGLSTCSFTNGCLEKHKMSARVVVSPDWSVETSLDVEWAHAIAPGAKILLVEATSDTGPSFLNAINYARARSDVVAISMSWGGDEFSSETSNESNFVSQYGATFFAAAGDSGHGTSWPAVSANVISVGGTSLSFSASGKLTSESAWTSGGGGKSSYIAEPAYQLNFTVPRTSGHRAVPDVAYNADPGSGYPVYDSSQPKSNSRWFIVGGTSAGTPQWAALRTIDKNISLKTLYQAATKVSSQNFRDVTSGSNGSCVYFCDAKKGYDYITGLGSPLGVAF